MNALDPSITALIPLPLAYLDPGSGAIIVQMLLAGVAGAGLFLKYQGRRILNLMGLRRKLSGDAPGDGPSES